MPLQERFAQLIQCAVSRHYTINTKSVYTIHCIHLFLYVEQFEYLCRSSKLLAESLDNAIDSRDPEINRVEIFSVCGDINFLYLLFVSCYV